MDTILIVALIVLILALAGVIIYLVFGASLFGGGAKKAQFQNIISSQRHRPRAKNDAQEDGFDDMVEKVQRKEVVTSKLTLEKKLRYARLSIPPLAYYLLMVFISVVAVFITSRFFDLPIILISFTSGPVFMSWLLNFLINRRFKAFDKDYPAFLLNVVSMLKIGMNIVGALQAAADGLSDEALVKQEVTLMLDRLRLGVSEEKSIGAFGEDIYHPEIELFVQAVILSRRLGGNLSETLDRLAAQVRKRQHFRESAEAAVGLQRGSIWIIIAIMLGLELYLYIASPDLIVTAFKDPLGWMIWQSAIIVILTGIYWVRQVTKLKV